LYFAAFHGDMDASPSPPMGFHVIHNPTNGNFKMFVTTAKPVTAAMAEKYKVGTRSW
jgi:hypothetical protein